MKFQRQEIQKNYFLFKWGCMLSTATQPTEISKERVSQQEGLIHHHHHPIILPIFPHSTDPARQQVHLMPQAPCQKEVVSLFASSVATLLLFGLFQLQRVHLQTWQSLYLLALCLHAATQHIQRERASFFCPRKSLPYFIFALSLIQKMLEQIPTEENVFEPYFSNQCMFNVNYSIILPHPILFSEQFYKVRSVCGWPKVTQSCSHSRVGVKIGFSQTLVQNFSHYPILVRSVSHTGFPYQMCQGQTTHSL